MTRIILITGHFPIYKNGVDTGRTEFVVSHGIEEDTLKNVVLPSEHPLQLGARFDSVIKEWVLEEDK